MAFIAQAQQVRIKVTDAAGEGLPGVTVKLTKSGVDKKGESTLSNADGVADISIPVYPAEIEISNLGYITQLKALKEQPAGLLHIVLEQKYTSLNEVVVTGVGRPTRLDEAVSVYKIITAADMRSQGAVTLNDALRNQLGLNINQDASLGSNINMRGLSGSNIKIMVDGLPLNGREGANIDLSQINLNNIEKVEMVQGPMNVMYGSDAIGGVINLVTKTNKDGWSAGGNAFYESIGRYNYGVDASRMWGRHNLSLNFGRNFFQGWDPVYDTVRDPLWRPKVQYLANLKYTWKFSEHTALTFASDYLNEMLYLKGTASELTQFNRTTKDVTFNTQRSTNRLQLRWKTGANGYWESNNSYALYHRRRETNVTDLTTMEQKLSEAAGDQSVNTFDNIISRTTYNNQAGIFNYTFGYDVNLEFASGAEKIQGGSKFIGDYALFLTTDIKVLPMLTLQPAFRFIYNTAYNAPLSPSLSVLYKPLKALQFRGSYSRGFRAPTLKELYLDFHDANHSISGNPDLKAEYSHHFQVSGGYTYWDRPKKSALTTLTAYYDDVRNQIALATDGSAPVVPGQIVPNIYSNIGRSRLLVLQLNNEFRFDALRITAGASYTRSFSTASMQAKGAADTLYVTPSFHYIELNGSARYDIAAWKAGIAVFYKYTGSQPLVGTIEGGSIFGDKMKDYHNIDASIEKSFWKERIVLNAGVRNITNNQIVNSVNGATGGGAGGHSGGGSLLLTPGRSFFASLRVQIGK